MIAGGQRDSIAVAFFAGDGEQEAQKRRKVLLDVRRDDVAECRAALQPLHLRVEPRQRDNRFDSVLTERAFQLAIGEGRVQRRDDRAQLPCRELGDDELWTVGKKQRNPVIAADAPRA